MKQIKKENKTNKDTLKLDPKGYFLIRINKKTKEIETAFCTYKEKKPSKIWKNKDPEILFNEIIKTDNYISLDSHRKYLKNEFIKAKNAIDKKIEYIQD